MQFSHAFDRRLPSLLVALVAEGGVFLRESVQGQTHLLLVGFGLGLHGDLNHRCGEVHALENDGVVGVAKSVASHGVLQSHHGDNITCTGKFHLGSLVGMHLQHSANALGFSFHGVAYIGSCSHNPGVDAGEGQGAHEGVVHDLEGQSRERFLIAGGAGDDLFRVDRIYAFDGRHVKRTGHVVDDRVQKRLHSLVLEGSASQYRSEGEVQRPCADAFFQLLQGWLVAIQVLHKCFLVLLYSQLDQLGTIFGRLLLQLIGNWCICQWDNIKARPEVLAIPNHRGVGDQVDHTGKVSFSTNGKLQHHWGGV
mmetsp:Transcript_30373/g.50840  ORF Transcript_30373/g.50840 Transcript_30373/m.50840 type:complete len:309 (+) Transcript_30373:981-1907(+)